MLALRTWHVRYTHPEKRTAGQQRTITYDAGPVLVLRKVRPSSDAFGGNMVQFLIKLLCRCVLPLLVGLLVVRIVTGMWQQALGSRPAVLCVRTCPGGAEILISPTDDPALRTVGKAPIRVRLPGRAACRKGVWSILARHQGYWPLLVQLPAEKVLGRRKTVEMRLRKFTLESLGALPVVYQESNPKRRGDGGWRIARLDRKRPPRTLRVPRCGDRFDTVRFSWSPGAEGILVWSVVYKPVTRDESLQDFFDWLCEDCHYSSCFRPLRARYLFEMVWRSGNRARLLRQCEVMGSDDGYYLGTAFTPDGEWIAHDWDPHWAEHQALSSLVTDKHIDLPSSPDLAKRHPAVSPDGARVSFVRESANRHFWILRSLSPGDEQETEITKVGPWVFGEHPIAFSPDNKWIALLECGNAFAFDTRIRFCSVKEGSNPNPTGQSGVFRYEGPVGGLHWSTDGEWLAVGWSVAGSGRSDEWGDEYREDRSYEASETVLLRVHGGRVLGKSTIQGDFAGWLPDLEHFLVWDRSDATLSVVGLHRQRVARFGAPSVLFSSPKFSPNAQHVAAIGTGRNGRTWLYLFDTSRPNPKRLCTPDVPIGRFEWDGDKHILIYERGGDHPRWRLDVLSGKYVRAPRDVLLQAPREVLTDLRAMALFKQADLEVLDTNERVYRAATWSADGHYAVLSRNGHLWLYSGGINDLPDRAYTHLRRITPLGGQCFLEAVVAPTIPPKVRRTRTGWLVQPDY